jgi:SAM-dependent methyltransferase
MHQVKTVSVKVYSEHGSDIGYLQNRQNWWFDPRFPHSFELFDLDSFYEDNYFRDDHVGPQVVARYVDAVLHYAEQIIQRPVTSVLEAGCGGGWFTKKFVDRGIDILAIEGTGVGLSKAVERGVPPERLLRHDLRRPLQLGRRFDVAVCTEVAEHLECPFAGQLVQTLVDHSDVIWFSFEPPGTNEAHYHHSNEQPPKFWINLFRFHDYRVVEIPADLIAELANRGKYIFCSPRVTIPTQLTSISLVSSPASLGRAMRSESTVKYMLRRITPPILVDLVRKVRKPK